MDNRPDRVRRFSFGLNRLGLADETKRRSEGQENTFFFFDENRFRSKFTLQWIRLNTHDSRIKMIDDGFIDDLFLGDV